MRVGTMSSTARRETLSDYQAQIVEPLVHRDRVRQQQTFQSAVAASSRVVACQGTFRIRLMFRIAGGFGAVTITAQIRTDHSKVLGQSRCYAMPTHGLRIPMKQQNRWTTTGRHQVDSHLRCRHLMVCKIFKHTSGELDA